MSESVQDFYQSRAYPAMSHPSTDPAVTAVAARLAGLATAPPSAARILDIGCAAGHNLLPLAARWPDSRFTGIDVSAAAIAEARQTAMEAGLTNIEFIETDLASFDPDGGTFDFIIAHGVYSWVPAPVRQALVDFCARHLADDGIATLSYNTLPGWSLRQSLVDLTRLIAGRPAAAEIGADPERILSFLATVDIGQSPHASHLHAVIHDIMDKSNGVLGFDEFSPVNTPVTFLDFISHTHAAGLRYLGESQLFENLPTSLPPGAADSLKPLASDPLVLQQTIDVLTNRTFRSSLLCRASAPLDEKLSIVTVLQFAVRGIHLLERSETSARLLDGDGKELARFEHPLAIAFFAALTSEAMPMQELLERMAASLGRQFDPTASLPSIARLVMDAARQKLIEVRFEPTRFDPNPPRHPNLGPLRLIAARKGQPLVDAYHVPCSFGENRKPLLLAMDGRRSVEELAALAIAHAPQLDFNAWLHHLAGRGMFQE